MERKCENCQNFKEKEKSAFEKAFKIEHAVTNGVSWKSVTTKNHKIIGCDSAVEIWNEAIDAVLACEPHSDMCNRYIGDIEKLKEK